MESNATPEIAMIAGAILVLIGCGLLMWPIRILLHQRREMKEHTRTTGVVVENKITEGMDNTTFYWPIVEFTVSAASTHRVQCLGSSQMKYPVGTSVTVLYDPVRPDQAGIVGESTFGAALLMILAAFPIGLGFLFLVLGLIGKWSGGF